MFKLPLLALCALLAAVVAYNFDDPDFNNFLLGDFQDITSTARVKRDADCHKKHDGFHCCKEDKFDPKIWEAFKQMKRECMKEVIGEETIDEMVIDPFDCQKMEKVKSDIICVSECVARKASFISDEGVIDKDVILTSLKSKVEGVEWKMAAAEGIVVKCLGDTKNIEKGDGKCSAAPMKITKCIWSQFIQSCPAELQSDSKRCKKVRERLNAGDSKSFLISAFIHHLHNMEQIEKDR